MKKKPAESRGDGNGRALALPPTTIPLGIPCVLVPRPSRDSGSTLSSLLPASGRTLMEMSLWYSLLFRYPLTSWGPMQQATLCKLSAVAECRWVIIL
jgi:hypothetical protein